MSSELPLVSVLCAIRNDVRFIRETLDSVIRQNYTNWELIVLDGASTDGTVEIVKEFAQKYPNIIFHSEADDGQWQALDRALTLAKGQYIMQVCGQDGYLNNDWMARCVEVFLKKPEISLVWGIPFDMSEGGELLGPHYAYATFLRDSKFSVRPRPFKTIMAKIDIQRSSAIGRLGKILKKFTWKRIKMVFRSFFKTSIPQREDWFFYWLNKAAEQGFLFRLYIYKHYAGIEISLFLHPALAIYLSAPSHFTI